MKKTQAGTRDELQESTGLGVVEDAVQVFIARQQLELNSFLPDDACERLRAELRGAMLNGTEYAVEVVQRYHSLIGLLSAVARYDGEVEASRHPTASTSARLHRAVTMATGYGWTVTWSKFNTRIERVQ